MLQGKLKLFFIVAFVVLVLGLLMVGSWYGWKKWQEKGTVEKQEENINVATTTVTNNQANEDRLKEKFKDDQDGDGIKNEQEEQLGLKKNDFDTDQDGLSDWVEVNITKTDPKKQDTDSDGYTDGEEIFNDYNPLGPGKLPSIK